MKEKFSITQVYFRSDSVKYEVDLGFPYFNTYPEAQKFIEEKILSVGTFQIQKVFVR